MTVADIGAMLMTAADIDLFERKPQTVDYLEVCYARFRYRGVRLDRLRRRT
jgi:hypothetical protein